MRGAHLRHSFLRIGSVLVVQVMLRPFPPPRSEKVLNSVDEWWRKWLSHIASRGITFILLACDIPSQMLFASGAASDTRDSGIPLSTTLTFHDHKY